MRIIAKRTLREFWKLHSDAEQPLRSWYDISRKEIWNNFNEIKSLFRNASIVGNDKVVFNIKGNDYRLVVKVDFNWKVLFIKFIGTHHDYDKLNVKNL
ncbi:MAG: type II toxin-antitoxin system HigB family toxin [Ignavibacteria bacterium]|nr:type II toxin-antitoxin system HigB family toxin [Ignavibacteria bacterium]